MKHTSGPWVIDWEQGYGINAEQKHIALVSYFQSKEGDREENEANARLIAAAPELLEALQSILPMLEHFLMIDGDPEPGSIGHSARSAIAKATGTK